MAQLFLGSSLRRAATEWRWLQSVLWLLEAGILGAFWWFCSWLPPDRAVAFGHGVLSRIGPRLAKHRQIKANLRVAFPEKDAAQIEALARGVWGNLGAVLAEYPHLNTIIADPTGRRLEVILKTDLTPYAQGQKAAIFVNAHLGNWELPPVLGKSWKIPLAVLYGPLQNPWLERMLWRKRQLLGCELLDKAKSMKATVQRLSSGTSMGLLVDQRVDSGEPIPFFGRDALTTSSPARLALKFGCALIPIQVERLHGAHFRVTVHPPLTPDDDQAAPAVQARQMTRQLNALFEDWIRQHPQQWLCTKRRWPQAG